MSNAIPHHAARSLICTEVRPEQPEKARSPMLSTLEGMVIAVRPVQFQKARSPMLSTLAGMVIEVRLVQW